MSLTALALTQAVKARAVEVGFDRVAVGPAGPAEHAGRFEAWLDAGYAGGMDYLARTRVERCLLYTSPSPRDLSTSRMPSSA